MFAVELEEEILLLLLLLLLLQQEQLLLRLLLPLLLQLLMLVFPKHFFGSVSPHPPILHGSEKTPLRTLGLPFLLVPCTASSGSVRGMNSLLPCLPLTWQPTGGSLQKEINFPGTSFFTGAMLAGGRVFSFPIWICYEQSFIHSFPFLPPGRIFCWFLQFFSHLFSLFFPPWSYFSSFFWAQRRPAGRRPFNSPITEQSSPAVAAASPARHGLEAGEGERKRRCFFSPFSCFLRGAKR